jgi:uncharacterized tellurite resistance protein B-like protein
MILWHDFSALINSPGLQYTDFAEQYRLHMATAALLVHAAFADTELHESEVEVIRALTRKRFGYDDTVLDNLIINAQLSGNNSVPVRNFLNNIQDNFNDEEKLSFFNNIWSVLVADGKIHPYEQKLADFLAQKLGIPDNKHEEIKKQAMQKSGLF